MRVNQLIDAGKRETMNIKRLVFLATLLLCLSPLLISRPAASQPRDTTWFFVEVETKVTRKGVETSSENPEERRWYMSTVAVLPDDVPSYSLVKKKIIPYFNRNVMDPFEARGFALDYYDQNVKLSGENTQVDYATKEEAEEVRNKEIEYRKGQGGNIYSFELDFSSSKGEETSKPKLIYRDKGQPNYGGPK
jgi:hypothetical protein